MLRRRIASLSLFTLLFLALAVSPAMADTLVYDNGPINGTINAWTINFGYLVTDSFTLSAATNVDSVQFGTWLFPGDTVSSVDWGISAAPYGTNLGTGTSATSNSFQYVNGFGYDIYENAFSFAPIALGPGTYYLTLFNAVAPSGDPIYWDENDGPSTAYENTVGQIGSESFQVYGSSSTPEPASMILLGTGLVGLALRRKLFKA